MEGNKRYILMDEKGNYKGDKITIKNIMKLIEKENESLEEDYKVELRTYPGSDVWIGPFFSERENKFVISEIQSFDVYDYDMDRYIKFQGSKGFQFVFFRSIEGRKDERIVKKIISELNKELKDKEEDKYFNKERKVEELIALSHIGLDEVYKERFRRLMYLVHNNSIKSKMENIGNVGVLTISLNGVVIIVTPNIIYDIKNEFIIFMDGVTSEDFDDNIRKYEGRLDDFKDLYINSRDRRTKI